MRYAAVSEKCCIAELILALGDGAGDARPGGTGVPARAVVDALSRVEACEASRDNDGRCGRVYSVPGVCPCRAMSRDCRAGVDRPEAEIEGCLLNDPAAAARSAEACD